MWAERYDRDLGDIFELQDELVEAITAHLRPTLRESAAHRVPRQEGRSFDAWDLTIQGQFHPNTYTAAGCLRAIELFDEARRLEPDFAAPVAGTTMAWVLLAHGGWRGEGVNPWQRGAEEAEAAYRLDGNDYAALGALSVVRSVTGRPDEGANPARRMMALNPYAPFGAHTLGNSLDQAVEHAGSIAPLTQAWRLGRHDPLRFGIANDLAHSHYMAGEYEPAVSWAFSLSP